MTITETPLFDKVWDIIDDGQLIAWDGCHKIYLALDDIEAEWFRANYETTFEGTADELVVTLGKWWDESCFLRFINAVEHQDDADSKFTTLIGQGDDEVLDEDEDDE